MLTVKQVIRKRDSIKGKIDKLYKELDKLQKNDCPHHNLRYRYNGSSGGWDYDANYWIDFYCPDCRHRWQTDQSPSSRKLIADKYSHAKQIDRYNDSYKYKVFYEDWS